MNMPKSYAKSCYCFSLIGNQKYRATQGILQWALKAWNVWSVLVRFWIRMWMIYIKMPLNLQVFWPSTPWHKLKSDILYLKWGWVCCDHTRELLLAIRALQPGARPPGFWDTTSWTETISSSSHFIHGPQESKGISPETPKTCFQESSSISGMLRAS